MSNTRTPSGDRYDPENDPNVHNEARSIEGPVGDDVEAGPSRDEQVDDSATRREKLEPEANPVHAGRNAIYAARKQEREEDFDGEDEARTLVWPKGMEPEREEEEAPAPKRKLKVYGEERELTQDEIDALAQKQLASDTKFEDYKALEARARAAEIELEVLRRAGPQARQEPEIEPEDTEAQTRAAERRAKKLEALNAIQMGDPEEALSAFDSLLEDARTSPEEFERIADQRYEQRRLQEEADNARKNAVQTFAEAWPEIVESPDLPLVVARRSHERMVTEMQKIGVPDNFIAAARQDASLARTYYDDLRDQGHALPDAMKVINDSAESTVRDFNIPRRERQTQEAPAARANDRSARIAEKRTLTQEPPRAASQERTRPAAPQTREEAVAKMRAARGQPT